MKLEAIEKATEKSRQPKRLVVEKNRKMETSNKWSRSRSVSNFGSFNAQITNTSSSQSSKKNYYDSRLTPAFEKVHELSSEFTSSKQAYAELNQLVAQIPLIVELNVKHWKLLKIWKKTLPTQLCNSWRCLLSHPHTKTGMQSTVTFNACRVAINFDADEINNYAFK